MSIDLSPEHQDFVRQELKNGHFANERELIAEALELLRARQRVLGQMKPDNSQMERGRTPNGNKSASLKELILAGPSLEGIDLERDKSTGRELDL